MPADRLLSYLRLTSASLDYIDAIVCNADIEPDGLPRLYSLKKAVTMANQVADLPESIAMRTDRKWRMIPFVIVGDKAFYFEQWPDLKGRHASIIRPDPNLKINYNLSVPTKASALARIIRETSFPRCFGRRGWGGKVLSAVL
jgi:hypothetical protein